jgi:anti-sigma regulatory factor (Ser/Thr protein kinase)
MIAVTTRARVAGARHLWPALRATAHIRRELEQTPACLRFATVLSGPRELLTVSVWRSHQDVLDFVGTGSHGPAVWRRPGWLSSYWGMRWRPGGTEVGAWDGAAMGTGDAGGVAGAGSARAGTTERPRPGFDSSPLSASLRGEFDGSLGTTYRLQAPPGSMLAAVRAMRRLRGRLRQDPTVFACAGGVAPGRQVHLLVTWKDAAGARRFAASRAHHEFLRRWDGRVWWMEWLPEAETGRWDGQRLREQRLGLLASRPTLLDLRLAPTFQAPGQAREAFDQLHLELPEQTLVDGRLLLSELVTNGVRHARLAAHEWIMVRIQAAGGSIRVEVTDPGPGFEAGSEGGGGLGISLLRNLPDRWGILTGGLTRAWFEIDPRS